MYQIYIIEKGERRPLTDLAKFANRAVKRFDLKKQARRIPSAQLERLNDATLRETSPEEVQRRFENLKNQRG